MYLAALFGKESSVTRDYERLARISGWTWTICMSLERGPHEVHGIKDTARCNCGAGLTRSEIRSEKVKRSFPDSSKIQTTKCIYCFRKYILF